ncbi:MAG: hypothetical protein JNL10_13955 [Verrucomicrobiales bacterium]|nr:hypothetical protein [Verrucomicrobiales bacterium]
MNSFAGQQRGVPWPELALAVALAAIPLLAGRFLPLIDLPQHLAISRALAGLWQGEASFTQHFVVDPWPQPYWLYYLLVCGLAQVLTVEWANAAVIFAYSLGISLGVRHLLVTFGRNPHWWLVSVPLAWTSSFFYGFMAYLVGIPLVIFGIAEMERCTGAPPEDTRARWRLGILSLLIYLAHAQAFLWLLLSATVLLLLRWRSAATGLRTLVALGPSLALFAAWVWRTFVAATPDASAPKVNQYGTLLDLGMRWEPFPKRLGTGMEQLYGSLTDGTNRWLGWLWLAVVIGGIVLNLRTPDSSGSFRSRSGRTLALLLGTFLLAWMTLPYDLNGQWYLAPRYLVFPAAVAVVAAAGESPGHRRLLGLGIALSVAFSLNVARTVRAFQSTMEGLPGLLIQIPPGERVAHFAFDERNTLGPDGVATNGVVGVIEMPTSVSAHGFVPQYVGCPEGWMSPTHHASAYYQVWVGGDIASSFAAAPSNPVRYHPGRRAAGVVEYEPENVDWAVAPQHYRWFLVRGTLKGNAVRLGEFATQADSRGGWELWKAR